MSSSGILIHAPDVPLTSVDPLAFNHHPKQLIYERSTARVNIVAKGRRAGGTQIAKRRAIQAAMSNTKWPDFRVLMGGPTHQQAKNVWWDDIKRMLHPSNWQDTKIITDVSETELKLRTIVGSEIQVAGLDRPDRVEGQPINKVYVTEAPNCKPEAIEQHIFPMLSERNGSIDLEGAPEGRNHFYRWAVKAQEGLDNWAFHHWTTAEVMPYYLGQIATDIELDMARERLDELTYMQEYEAEFIHFIGMAYHKFRRETHVRKVVYDTQAPLHICFDFNISPGVAVLVQEAKEQHVDGALRMEDITQIVGDITIQTGSNTELVCQRLIAKWGDHAGMVYCYGDATGGAGGSAKLSGSDWDIIKRVLGAHFGGRMLLRVDKGNPRERIRVNAVNSRLQTASGKVHIAIAPEAGDIALDLEEVTVKQNGSGEIDKNANLARTHHSDAFGYYVHRQHPIDGGHKVFSVAI